MGYNFEKQLAIVYGIGGEICRVPASDSISIFEIGFPTHFPKGKKKSFMSWAVAIYIHLMQIFIGRKQYLIRKENIENRISANLNRFGKIRRKTYQAKFPVKLHIRVEHF